ncbi:methyltransferase domain-containing protein [Geotalea sp. SG265]|uniref:class I SAM-dependent methyltransferase n=1 Tax=Geotalea sp. SG265 TaxID=2922867 RepID=UPI001FAEF7E6|nr:methyltransferase domain-containing protein [Geotalea sp. SG265]
MQAATSILRYYKFFRQRNASTVLDYGAGKLRNALFLSGEGFDVFAADLPEQIERIKGEPAVGRLAGLIEATQLERTRLNVDLVISNYVFNIIPDGREKQHYLKNTVRNLHRGGYLLVEVRCRQNLVPCGSNCTHYMKCSSCVKTYSHEELDKLVIPYGFSHICHYYRHRTLAVVYQLAENHD